MILMPNNGKLVRNNGNSAQWIAHATVAVIPRASQFTGNFMGSEDTHLQQSCKIKYICSLLAGSDTCQRSGSLPLTPFMSRKTIFYIIFFAILVVGFYVTMSVIIPGFTKKRTRHIGKVTQFEFVNQDGKKVSNKDLQGKVYVAEYFFTTCKGICPKMTDQLKRVYDKFSNEPDFRILSHTSDPKTDSSAQLKAYATKLGVDTDKWIFVTGRKDSLYNMARFSYKIDDPANNLQNIEQDFLHTQFFALVDKQGNVRKIYDGIKPGEVDAMMIQIPKLLKE